MADCVDIVRCCAASDHACSRVFVRASEPNERSWYRVACSSSARSAQRYLGLLGSAFLPILFPYRTRCHVTHIYAWQVVDAFDPNSSAAEADLRQGDILSRVDGVDVIGMPVPTVAEKIFGPIGSPVRSSLKQLDVRSSHGLVISLLPSSPPLLPPLSI